MSLNQHPALFVLSFPEKTPVKSGYLLLKEIRLWEVYEKESAGLPQK